MWTLVDVGVFPQVHDICEARGWNGSVIDMANLRHFVILITRIQMSPVDTALREGRGVVLFP